MGPVAASVPTTVRGLRRAHRLAESGRLGQTAGKPPGLGANEYLEDGHPLRPSGKGVEECTHTITYFGSNSYRRGPLMSARKAWSRNVNGRLAAGLASCLSLAALLAVLSTGRGALASTVT